MRDIFSSGSVRSSTHFYVMDEATEGNKESCPARRSMLQIKIHAAAHVTVHQNNTPCPLCIWRGEKNKMY
jgi:hypothetical protein